MKATIRSVLVYALSIWATSAFIGGIKYNNDLKVLLLASLALTIGNILIIPLINLLLLPINILTLGSFKWVSVVLLLFVVTLVIPGFTVSSFDFPKISTPFFMTPSFPVNVFIAYFLISFILSIISNFFLWLVD
ncbi:MAG: Membrane protein [Microgenomates group bacterium GW2011_GWA2_44_7]|uniref:Membrane protein n=1 Tax=Candidatus Woesebacteria bacterium GW2011_GWA1_41_13b TaxID=1618555 RepID=A0A0G0USB9_9BACT|nr:MAG: Membrane protein [Candidatus Woesebacteria bacterium GW2011_GWA1_41_13b]KKT75126.1 MAG: Membrane protein [Microgenomates group bacterium GW2011_GWA2_44_7]KKT77180.1 MAG: Membrane protein [Microgenomates group bacterium GW2011_GWB1_44_8]